MQNRSRKPANLINDKIIDPKVRLVDENGVMIGIISREDALQRASEVSLDLVVVGSQDDLPTCKIMDYGKYRYVNQKKLQKAKKKQKTTETKEIKIRSVIQTHDYNIKLNRARAFIQDGNKVKFMLRFRGREIAFRQIALDLFARLQGDLSDIANAAEDKNNQDPLVRQLTIIFSPLNNK